MKILYDATLEELVDTNLRALGRSKTVRGWRWNGVIISALIAGTFLYVVIPESAEFKLLAGLFGALAAAVAQLFLHSRTTERRLRKWFREMLRSEGPFPTEIEIDDQGIWARQLGNSIMFGWPNIEAVIETPDSIDFIDRHGGMVVVRNRIFASVEQRLSFLREAHQYRDRHGKETAVHGT